MNIEKIQSLFNINKVDIYNNMSDEEAKEYFEDIQADSVISELKEF